MKDLPPVEEFLEALAQDIGDGGDPCSCHQQETGHPFLWFVGDLFQAPKAMRAWEAGEREGHHPTCQYHPWRDRVTSGDLPIDKPVQLPDGRIVVRKSDGRILLLRKKEASQL